MKLTINLFTKGLITELHPLMTDGTLLTDALNATIITYNGNEFMLLNDMGNTLIQDSKTGHIMGLSEGFVPVGVKEHGGIMYIVSADKHGNGEVGTIPSPILTVSLRTESYNDSTLDLCDTNGPKISENIISNENIFPGEKFIVVLNLLNTDGISTILLPDSSMPLKPLISKIDEKGLYDVELYTVTANSTISLVNKCKEAQEYINSSGLKESDYWFIDGVDNTINLEQTYKEGHFKTYPGNLPPGRLAIKVKLEPILSFGFIKSKQPLSNLDDSEKELDAPEIYFDSTDKSYHLLFPGFYYTTESSRYVKTVKMSVSNQLTTEIFLDNKEFILDTFEYSTKYDGKIFEFRHTKSGEPLVDVSIGKILNQWIKVRVEQYDQYDGKIDVFTYSFNPYHIINYLNLFFNPLLVPTITTQLYYNISNSSNDILLNNLHFNIPLGIQFINPRAYSFSLGFPGDLTDDECVEFYDYENGNTEYYPVITSNDDFSSDLEEEKSSFIIPALNLKYLVLPITVCYDYPVPHISVNFSDRGVISLDPDSKDSAIVQVYAGGISYGNICLYESGQYPDYGDNMTWNGSQICIVRSYTQEGGLGKYVHNSEENGQFEYDRNITINGHGTSFVGMSSYDTSDEAENIQWDGGPRIITVGIEGNNDLLTSGFKYAENQSFSNKSIYQVHEGFEIYAENEEGDLVLVGFDKKGKVKEAMTFGPNLIIEPIEKDDDTSITSSLYSNKKYLSKSSYIEKILNKGIYLLCFNYGFFGYGSATVTISGKSYSIPTFDNIIEPTLIYIPKKSVVKIEWYNLYMLHNIGLYEIDFSINYSGIEDITTKEEPIVISYHDDNIETEIILPALLTYKENVKCYQKTYDYYCGTKEPYYLDQIIYTDKDEKKVKASLIYTFDDKSEDLTETLISSKLLSESLGLTKTIKYRITDEVS